jgi:uncharacterized DUF497 family protein
MMKEAAGFDWDPGNRGKCQKRGVSLAEIELLLQTSAKIAPDIKHSVTEDRYVAVGRDSAGRAMFVVFTTRMKGGQRLIRPISARYMHRKEIAGYEEEEGASF